ncbi:MAG TPA: SdrD B-like domain-containing protein, partial [Ferruginibacter sp.]|nr:SdrD B-like domain-containing protein [Ferruginibacter sp.]
MNRFITKPVICFALPFVFFIESANSQASISGHIFSDNNKNGVYDNREGLQQVAVWLLDKAAVSPFYQVYPVQTVMSGPDGSYTFNNVANGDYQVKVKMSTLYNTLIYDPRNIITRTIADNNPYNPDNIPDGITSISITSATNYDNIDFGFLNN